MNPTSVRATAVRRAGTTDTEWLSVLLTDAFLISPVGDWLIPEIGKRRMVYLRYFEVFLNHGLERGIVEVTTDRTGVAIWLPRDDDTPGPDNYDQRLATATGFWANRFQVLDKTFDDHHPHGVFHHHLLFLGVLPSEQSRGIGSALLRHHHAQLDAEGIPAYLEASMPRNRDLYLRHGYAARDPFYLPDDGPPLWPMWRDPQPSTSTQKGDSPS
ncbi:GNAT family N-acetyltransferase [Catellatospora citrea]|uniref:N-acetyltransferase n=1 Tax=Catellatospora citrea TaxID=53366 RepID=A0A8J3KVP3_9ACTN|nr:GNAT family N-acetyltransferase [Catellatospora citrea]RKE07905.1 acetyltransferase (GNAT) family protein [Catellatospora citrea]GIG02085.1 N-acetyltransferase [Catellatospora citrea]